MIAELVMLIKALGIVAGIAMAIFTIMGPVIEMLFGMFFPEGFFDDDDNSAA